MAELTFPVSPGVVTREIDLSGPTQIGPTGIPAGVVGTAVRGPAFVPVTIATFQDFISVFGNSDGEKLGPMAMREWLRNAGSGTYVRVLGIGDGTSRKETGDNKGRVNNAGFVVGNRLPQGNGLLGNNRFAGAHNPTGVVAATAVDALSLGTAGGTTTPAANDDFTIQIPVAAGGTNLEVLVRIVAGMGVPGALEVYVLRDASAANTTTDRMVIAFNGTDAPGYDTDHVKWGSSVTGGTDGILGVTAEEGSDAAKVTLTCDALGTDGNSITIANDTGTIWQSVSMAGGDNAGMGILGRTQFLVAFMSASDGSSYFSDAGLAFGETARPIVRGVLMAPSGVVLALSSNLEANNAPSNIAAADLTWGTTPGNAGSPIGSINTTTQEFVFFANGLKNSDQYSNVITASLDTTAPNYFVNVLNTDPTKIEEAGHYLYAHYDIHKNLAVVTGTNITADLADRFPHEEAVLLLTSSQARNIGTSTTATTIGTPNWEGFEDRFATAFSPFVVSQKFGASNTNLFRFHTLSDGTIGSGEFKVTIENIKASNKANNKYGTFDVLIRRFMDNDLNPEVVESFRGCTLDPTADAYIAKRIGDRTTFFNFDAASGAQKIVVDGDYPNVSNFVRVEMSAAMANAPLSVDPTALPTGFRGLHHLVTSGTSDNPSILTGSYSTLASAESAAISELTLTDVVQPPVPLRESIATGVSPRKNVKQAFTWGVQFENKDSLTEPNNNEKIDSSLLSFSKYFPSLYTETQNPWVGDNEATADVGGSILDADRFNNNFFSLERIEVITGSTDRPDAQQWAAATYRRNGTQVGTLTDRDGTAGIGSRFLDPAKDFAHVPTQKYLKFTLPLVGGFDGLNIFDTEKSKMSDVACRREMDDTTQGGKNGPTVGAYRKAMDLMEAKQDVDVQLLTIPGIRHPSVTDYAIEATERRFDALFLMDVEEKDEVDTYVTSSLQIPSVVNTINRFAGRALDSSFAAAYYPDIVISDPATRTNVKAAPTVVVLGAFGLNDAVAFPWYAPAGFTRGALASALYPGVELLQQNRDDLYTADINPIIGDVTATSGVTVFGQKTLLAAQSALDRVNVRRLLIDVRRRVRDIARTFLFEPNRASTIAAFQARVQPLLADIQAQGGLDRFRVIVDTTTTTQADIENNTMRGRIFLQPTRSVEFVALDFVVSNSI